VFATSDNGVVVHRRSDGRTWERMQCPTTQRLRSIVGLNSHDVFVAGGYSNVTGVLCHFDGNAWRSVLTSSGALDTICSVGNMGVTGVQSDSLWVFGNGIFHRNGSSWENRTPKQQLGFIESMFVQGWNDAFACGDYGCLMHFNGSTWAVYPDFFSLSSTLVLTNIFAIQNEVWAIGDDGTANYLLHGYR
jgi:hypothetical protein